jgi:nucleoside-diphosphate-sugar epimerase
MIILNMSRILVAGGGGFIGGHLVNDLVNSGHDVIAVDQKPINDWYQLNAASENKVLNLNLLEGCEEAVDGVGVVYNLAADMGGMGFIENNKAACMLSVLINTHLLQASVKNNVGRFFYASSACVYAQDKQMTSDIRPLKEADAYPAMPEDGYGWEKLFGERMCRHFSEDFGIATRIARYHNVYGPHGTYQGGREKAPAAICRKVVEAVISGENEIQVWGDGNQTRSFTFIDDCVIGTVKLTESEFGSPVNIGSSELVSINQLLSIVEQIAGIKLKRKYMLDAPQGVRGRNSDNELINQVLNWTPSISLEIGIEKTYKWIYDKMVK